MNTKTFDYLLSLLELRLQKLSKRKPISPEERLGIAIMFLAHGCAPQVLAWSFKLGISTVRKIIYDTCEIIWQELNQIYLSPPNKEEFKQIAAVLA